MDEIKRSGMDQEHAEAITKATAKAMSKMMETKDIATKSDILLVRKDIQEMKSELIKLINENTWKTIGLLATFQTIILTVFGFLQYLTR
jgi:polyhydroxyalkanoate synthesis regulator phasin